MAELLTGIYRDRSSAEQAVDELESLGYKRDDISVIMHDRTRAKEFAEDTGTTAGSATKVADAAKSAAKIGGALAAILAGAAAVGALRHNKSEDEPTTITSSGQLTGPASGVAGSDIGARTDASMPSAERSASGFRAGALRDADISKQTTSHLAPDTKPFMAGPIAAILVPALGAGLVSAFSKAGIPKEHAERYAQELETGGIVVGVEARSGDEGRVRQALSA